MKQLLRIFLVFALSVFLVPVSVVHAAESPYTLRVSHKDGERGLSGVAFSLYKAEDALHGRELSSLSEEELIRLAGTISEGREPEARAETDGTGTALFTVPESGQYLVTAEAEMLTDGRIRQVIPLFVTFDGEQAELSAEAKHVLTSRPDEGSTPSETSGNQDADADKLPQTGMYHLEVALLAGLSAFFGIAGFLLFKRGQQA